MASDWDATENGSLRQVPREHWAEYWEDSQEKGRQAPRHPSELFRTVRRIHQRNGKRTTRIHLKARLYAERLHPVRYRRNGNDIRQRDETPQALEDVREELTWIRECLTPEERSLLEDQVNPNLEPKDMANRRGVRVIELKERLRKLECRIKDLIISRD